MGQTSRSIARFSLFLFLFVHFHSSATPVAQAQSCGAGTNCVVFKNNASKIAHFRVRVGKVNCNERGAVNRNFVLGPGKSRRETLQIGPGNTWRIADKGSGLPDYIRGTCWCASLRGPVRNCWKEKSGLTDVKAVNTVNRNGKVNKF